MATLAYSFFGSMDSRTVHLRFPQPLRQMPGDLCTAPGIISLSPLSLADRSD
jgi:hypothetical protein